MLSLTLSDVPVILLLVFLEGILSIDNALVLAMLARPLPRHLQKKALTYGLAGAVLFRLGALYFVTSIVKYRWIKILGGLYLIYLAIKHFVLGEDEDEGAEKRGKAAASFWRAVLVIELTDIAFAVDSILAAVGVSKKLAVVFLGGFLGVVMMRYAANLMIRMLERFPNLERTAYVLVLIIGVKVILETADPELFDFHSGRSPAFWVFWALMAVSIALGFRRGSVAEPAPGTEPR